MSRQRDPLILVDAALNVRYTLLLMAGVFLLAGIAGAGFLVTWFALLVIFAGTVSFAITYQTIKSTRTKRLMPCNRAFESALAQVTARVENHSPYACYLVQIEDRFPPAGRERQLVSLDRPLLPAQSSDIPLEFACQAKRGRYTIGPLRLVAYDLFGFFTLSAGDEQRYDFDVYPPPFPILDFPLAGHASSYSFGVFSHPRPGHGLDFAGIREYRDGDDTRHLHWPATAATGRLMLKEFEQTGAVQVTIFFDLSKHSLSGIGRHSTTEYAIKIAGSLTKHALEEGHQVQVLAEGDRLVYLPLGSGSWQLTSIMQELARVRPEGQRPLYDLVNRYVELVPEHSNVVLIFSKCDVDLDAYLNALNQLRARSVRITAILIDHTSFLPVFDLHQYAPSRQAQEALLRQGVAVYRVRQGDDLSQALNLPLTVAEASA